MIEKCGKNRFNFKTKKILLYKPYLANNFYYCHFCQFHLFGVPTVVIWGDPE